MSNPTDDERHGASPPAVRRATFFFDMGPVLFPYHRAKRTRGHKRLRFGNSLYHSLENDSIREDRCIPADPKCVPSKRRGGDTPAPGGTSATSCSTRFETAR